MDTLLQDVRYALRKLGRSPGFTIIATLTLALAIGANTAVFSVVNGVLLKPLPFAQPDRVMKVASFREGRPMSSSAQDYIDWRKQLRSFSYLAAYSTQAANLTGGAEPERVNTAAVGADFWRVLGVVPALGRGFAPNEDQPQAARVVVLSDALWRNHYGADPRIVGRTIVVDGNPCTVVGVAPASLTFPEHPDLWMPLVFGPDDLNPGNRGNHWLDVVGRLTPSATVESAARDLGSVTRRLEQQYPESNTGFSGTVMPLQQYMVGDVRPALMTLLAAVAFVLLIACANVANLQLVRATARETETAVRTALGAGRWRIVRQLLTESVLLSLAGGLVGALAAVWGVDLIVQLGPHQLPRLDEVRVDGTVLAFTALIALATGVVFGIIPAAATARGALAGVLKESARGSSGTKASRRARGSLVITEMALAMVLLVGAGLLVRSFRQLMAVNPGFRTERVLTFNVSAPPSKYADRHSLRALTADMLGRIRAIPGVRSAALVAGLPLGDFVMRTSAHVVGTPRESPSQRKRTYLTMVSPAYFATMGIPLIQGRDFATSDRSGAPIVAVVNQEFAKRYLAQGNALGQHIEIGWTQDTASAKGGDTTQVRLGGEVVGIVGNVKRLGLASETEPETYIAIDQPTINEFSAVVRISGPPADIERQIRGQMHAIDPDLPIAKLQQLHDLVTASVSQPRFYMSLITSFAVIALVLAAVGIYGVISYSVSQRSRELGIRIALGATRGHVMSQVLRPGLTMTVGGALIGILASLAVTRLIASLLFGVTPLDAMTFAGVPVILLGVAVVACAIPAYRASRVDPVEAMRAE